MVDLWAIANIIFEAETAISEGKRIECLKVPCHGYYSDELTRDLEESCRFLFNRPIQVQIVRNPQKRLLGEEHEDIHLSDGYTCLFSLGLDSFSGILNAKDHFVDLCGAFISHADQKPLLPLLNAFQMGPLATAKISVRRIDAVRHGTGMRRSRGIFYVLNGVALGRRNIIVCEVGPTMYQTPFTVLDDVAVTANPEALKLARRIAYDVLGERINILTPNEDLTKAEVAAVCQSRDYIRKTVSCGRSSFANSRTPNCGSCYPCIIRRLGVLVAGVQDARYKHDFARTRRRAEAYDDIVQLFRFSLDFIKYPEHIPWHTLHVPRKYGKLDLFERFALDNLAGLMILADQVSLNPPLLRLYQFAQGLVSKEQLKERIAIVREKRHRPNFENLPSTS